MKRILYFFLIIVGLPILAQNDPIWMKLERGKDCFERRDYGEAMVFFRQCLAIENITADSLPERLTKADVADLKEKIVYDTDLAFFETTLIEDEFFFRVKSDLSEFDRIRLANLFQEYQYQPKNPEVYLMIARILEIEGEFELAVKNYQIALEQAKSFELDTSLYEIYYFLIELYIKTGNQAGLTQAFDELRSYNAFMKSEKGKTFVSDIYASFKKSGLNKTLELYRRTNDSFLKAYQLAGDRYAEAGDNENAAKFYLLHIVIAMSTLIEEVPNVAQLSSGLTVEQVLEEALRNDYMLRFIKSIGLFESFYRMGEALYACGDWQKGQNFFWLTARYSPDAEFREKASNRWNEIAAEKID